jgi:hypothetical protein
MEVPMGEDLKERVRKKYAELAVASRGTGEALCCGPSCGSGEAQAGSASVIVDLARGSYSAASASTSAPARLSAAGV